MGNGFFQSVRALLRLKPAQKLNRDYLISLLCAVLLGVYYIIWRFITPESCLPF